MRAGKVKVAVFDDTCGNLIQLMQVCAGSWISHLWCSKEIKSWEKRFYVRKKS
jgi:hypothetical protein